MNIENKKSAAIVKASRELVDALLSINTNNRAVKKRVVDKYRRDIREGNWYFTNQGIGVYEDMTLADGQHRLWGLKLEGYPPVELLLVTGLKKEAGIGIDQHAKRTARDAFEFAFNLRVHYHAPAVANILFQISRSWQGGGSTTAEIYDILNEYQDEMSSILNTPKSKNFFSSAFLTGFVVCLRANEGREQEIVDFMKLVEEGEMLTKSSPAFHLRNIIVFSKKGSSAAALRKESFLKTVKATQSYLDGKEMHVLRA